MKIGVVKQLAGDGYQKGVEDKFNEAVAELLTINFLFKILDLIVFTS